MRWTTSPSRWMRPFTHGNISAAARKMGMSRLHLKRRLERTPELVAVLQAERDMTLDRAEENIFNAVHEGDFGASRFVLSTLGRDRGYAQRNTVQPAKSFTAGDNTIIFVPVSPPEEG